MLNAVPSALRVARALLPIATGGPISLAPALSNFQAALSGVGNLLQDLLGMGAPAQPIEGEEPAPAREDEPEDARDREEAERDFERTTAADERILQVRQMREALRRPEPETRPGDGADFQRPGGFDPTPRMTEALPVRAEAPAEAAPAPLPPPPAAPDLPPPAAAVETSAALEDAPVPPPPPPAAAPALSSEAAPALAATPPVQAVVELVQRPAPSRSDLPAAGGSRGTEGRPASPRALSAASNPEERADLVERIVRAARLTQSRGAARIKIALNPPHLGELKVDLSIRQRVLHGTLQAEHAAARELLVAHLGQLRDALEGQGLRVGDLQVQVDQSFQEPRQGGERASAPQAAEAYGRGGPGDLASVAARPALRSARLQLFDVVA